MAQQPAQYIFSMQGLSKTYPGGKEVLKNIWLSFLPGAKIGVLGANGAGKSTLVKILTGAISANAGRILVRGVGPVHLWAEDRKAQAAGGLQRRRDDSRVHQRQQDVAEVPLAEQDLDVEAGGDAGLVKHGGCSLEESAVTTHRFRASGRQVPMDATSARTPSPGCRHVGGGVAVRRNA